MKKIHVGIAAAAALILTGCGGGSSGNSETAKEIESPSSSSYVMQITKNDSGDINKIHVEMEEKVKNPSTSIQKTLYINEVSNISGYYKCLPVKVDGLPAVIQGTYNPQPTKVKFDIAVESNQNHCKDVRYIRLTGGYKLVSTTNGGKTYKKWEKIIKNPEYSLQGKYDVFPANYSNEIDVPKYHKDLVTLYVVEAEHPDEKLDIDTLAITSENGAVAFYKTGSTTPTDSIVVHDAQLNKISFVIEGKYQGEDNLKVDVKLKNGDSFSKKIHVTEKFVCALRQKATVNA